jgi:hypothetical protein
MSADQRSGVRPAPGAATARPARLARARRGSLMVLAALVAEYGIGMYINLYVAVPRSDRGGDLGGVISGGPAVLSVHAVLGLLLGAGALAILVLAVLARHWVVAALSAAGLLAMGLASVAGTGFTGTGDAADSMAMAVMTGVALLCYAVILFVLRRAAR